VASTPAARQAPDLASFGGILVGIGAVFGGLLLEGGKLSDVTQLTGAIIVFGGTLGAVMVTTPMATLLRAIRQLKLVFFEPRYSTQALIREVIEFGNMARKNGIVSLERDVENVRDSFFRKALSLGVDGTDLEAIRKMMDLELEVEADRGRADAKVFETAGGYSPTIGIIGAVLGLIQVMKNLENIEAVGHGIAVAFVATVYGVASANLFFLPAAGKIRSRVEQSIRVRELMLEGVCSIVQGLHPTIIERKLEAYARDGMDAKPQGRSRAVNGVEQRASV
jgi:chemotaxis protein MotA